MIMTDEQLAKYRSSIDNIDAALVHLLAERFKITQEVGTYKASVGLPAADLDRDCSTGLAATDDTDKCAGLHELGGDSPADPCGPSRNDCGLSGECEVDHLVAPSIPGVVVSRQN